MNKVIPQETQNIIALITDPYHDTPMANQGYPDGSTVYSYNRKIVGSASITCPFTMGTNDTWQVHVFTTPLHYQVDLALGQIVDDSHINPFGPTGLVLGPLNVVMNHIVAGVITETKNIVLGNNLGDNIDSPTRTVSLGYEIHNTTEVLYRCGTITQYRVPSMQQRADLFVGSPYAAYTCTQIATIPFDQTQALQTPNSHKWGAEQGVYAVALPAPDNCYSPALGQNVLIRVGTSVYGNAPGGGNRSPRWSPLNCVGTFITDLNPQSKFTLDFRQVLETRPQATDAFGLELATGHLPVDTLFLKMYKRMIPNIPPGVPVSFNSLGKWFRGIVDVADKVLPHVVQYLPPKAQLIATPVAAGVKLLNQKLQQQKQEIQQLKQAEKSTASSVATLSNVVTKNPSITVNKPMKRVVISKKTRKQIADKAQRFLKKQ